MPNSDPIMVVIGTAQASGPVPAEGFAPTPDTGTLLIACLALTVVATVAIVNVVAMRRVARKESRKARHRSAALKELLRAMRTAERIAGIGVWQYDYRTGKQQWSSGLKRIFGIDADAELGAGDAETVLLVNDIDLVGMIRQHTDETEPFALCFEIRNPEGTTRTIEVEACNLCGSDNQMQCAVAVLRDVTEEFASGKSPDLDWQDDDRTPFSPPEQPGLGNELIPVEIDALTGLADRRRIMRELDRYVLDARLSLKPLVLVMFDIDHLKRFNDTYGRGEGDLILQTVARIAQGQAREADLVGRVGGEEFVWIIPQATDGMARVMTERLRQAIARGSGVGGIAPVTISLGFSSIHSGDTALSLFARADSALYEAKNSGRNRVRVAA